MTARKAKLERETRETRISVCLNIDGSGGFETDGPDRFLRHMCETLARYSGFDLALKFEGDDEHHVVEDVAIALGETLRRALGENPAVRRASSCVIPMDDALVLVSVDLVGRPYCDADCPDPLYRHFLRSFAMSAGMNLHAVVMRGFDEHHIIESTFKALGRCLGQATRPADGVLSTKGAVREG